LRDAIAKQRENLGKGESGDRMLMTKFQSSQVEINVLRGSEDGIQAAYVADAAKVHSGAQAGSLLDAPLEKNDKERELVGKVDALMQQLHRCKTERQQDLAALKERMQKDEIHDKLVHQQSNVSAVMNQELQKYNDIKERITQNIVKQAKLMDDLTAQHTVLAGTELAKKSINASQTRVQLTKRLQEGHHVYHEVRSNVIKGIEFYAEVKDLADGVRSKCETFSKDRERERQETEGKMANAVADALQQKLAKMSVSSTPAAPSSMEPLKSVAPLAAPSASTPPVPHPASAPPPGVYTQPPMYATAPQGMPMYAAGQPPYAPQYAPMPGYYAPPPGHPMPPPGQAPPPMPYGYYGYPYPPPPGAPYPYATAPPPSSQSQPPSDPRPPSSLL
jgi:hypothetical protein